MMTDEDAYIWQFGLIERFLLAVFLFVMGSVLFVVSAEVLTLAGTPTADVEAFQRGWAIFLTVSVLLIIGAGPLVRTGVVRALPRVRTALGI